MAAPGARSTVRVPGIVLSSLMLQHLNSDSDVEGLILGESISEEQVTISDSQADHIHIEETFNIKKHIACQKLHSFYSSAGDIDLNAVKKLLGDGKPDGVIGWYKQRRNTEQQMTLREKTIHKNLKTTLSNPHMIFLLLTPSSATASGSTHQTEYAAFNLRCSEVIKVPIVINNLGLLDPLSYCKAPASSSAAGYNLIIKKHQSKFFSSNGCLKEVENINKMNESLQSELDTMCRDVEKSERQLETLRLEVTALRRKLKEKKSNQLLKEPSSPPSEPKRNILLHEAIKALFSGSPLFQSQTLTTTAFPVLDFCCSLQREEDTPAGQPETPSTEDTDSEPIQRKWVLRRRPIERLPGNQPKRRKI